MDLNINNKFDEYYQKFIELQEKLKRSEEQRFVLEMKFNDLVQVAKEEEQTHYKKLRAQYKKFLEEDQKRQDRNERIIRNLERVEAKISMLSAKTERISMFRRQYQKYLQRIANSYPEKKITDSKISRERSFVKEEPLKEQQLKMFRDDHSLPERPKDTMITNKDKPIYEHPAVKKSLEKDRSNEEKIEILDRYLQNISSQRCRDVLNHERQAREKLSLDTPIDKLFTDDFSLHSTNHATAVADDIMNSIYSRYYTKAEIVSQGNEGDLPKNMQNRSNENSNYGKKEFKPDDKTYSSSMFDKRTDDVFKQNNPTVTFKDGENVLLVKENKDGEILEKTYSNSFEKVGESYYLPDHHKEKLLAENNDLKQGTLKHAPENNVRNGSDNYNSIDTTNKILTTDLKTNSAQNEKLDSNIWNGSDNYNSIDTTNKILTTHLKTNSAQNEKFNSNIGGKGLENKNHNETVSTIKGEPDNNLPHINNYLKNVDPINKDPQVFKLLEENENIVPCDSSSVIADNFIPKIVPSNDQNIHNIVKKDDPQKKEQIKQVSQEQVFEYESQAQVQNQLEEQPLEYDPNNQFNQPEEPYHPEEQYGPFNMQNEEGQYMKDTSENGKNSANLETSHNNQGDQLMYNQDQSSIQYDPNGESMQPIQDDANNQPYDQNQHDENVQPNQYDPLHPLQYGDNSSPLAQFGNEQPTEFVENDPSYQQIQYEGNGQSIQYDESGQPVGYDAYGQPIMYDQNGQIVQPQYDENGQFIPQYDESGQMIILYDHNGQALFGDQTNQQYDLNGQPMQYDENGQPINDQNQQQYYDYGNPEQAEPNVYNQYPGHEQGQYIESQEVHAPIEDTGNQQAEESNNYYQVGDQGPYPNAEGGQNHGDNPYQEGTGYNPSHENTGGIQGVINEDQQNNGVGEENEVLNNEIANPTNVMDILDTDTESAKQNTSKISNESDFDFS